MECNIQVRLSPSENVQYWDDAWTADIYLFVFNRGQFEMFWPYAVHLQMHPTDSDMHHGKHPSSLWRRITLSCVKRILFSGTKEIFPLAEQFSNTEVRVLKHGRDEQRHLLFMSMATHSLETEGTLVVHHFRVFRWSCECYLSSLTGNRKLVFSRFYCGRFCVSPRVHWSNSIFNRCPPGPNGKTLCVALFIFQANKSSSVLAVKMWHRKANIHGCHQIWNTAPSKTSTGFTLLSGQRGKEGNRRTISSSALNPILLGFLFWNLPTTSSAYMYKSFTWPPPPTHTQTHTRTPHVPYWALQRRWRRK